MFITRTSTIDEKRLTELIDESQDLHSVAMHDAKRVLPDLRDLASDRRNGFAEPARLRADAPEGIGFGTKLALGGAFGTVLASMLAKTAKADEALDIQILQTASSLEVLAVATYQAALGLPFIADGNPVIVAFAETTMMQHDEHRAAFQAQTEALGGTVQDQPNPKFVPVVEEATPTLMAPIDVVKFAALLEKAATDTYLINLGLLEDPTSMTLMGSVMGVECQHLATLLAVAALIDGGAEELVAIPTDLAALPAAAGSVAFPDALHQADEGMIAEPETGAVA